VLLCQWHFDRTRDDLLAIPGYVAYIAAAPDGKVARRAIHAYVSDRSATKVTQASPSEAWDTAELVIQWAFAWAEIVADLRHHRGPFRYLRSGVPARDIQATIDYLSAHIEYIAALSTSPRTSPVKPTRTALVGAVRRTGSRGAPAGGTGARRAT
jgi:hypothetical protein